MSTVLRTLGVIYALFGVASAFTVYLYALSMPPLRQLSSTSAWYYSTFLGVWFVNGVACLALAYGLFRLKSWSKWLAVIVNGGHSALGVGVLAEIATDPMAGPVWMVLGYVTFFATLMGICVSKRARAAMTR